MPRKARLDTPGALPIKAIGKDQPINQWTSLISLEDLQGEGLGEYFFDSLFSDREINYFNCTEINSESIGFRVASEFINPMEYFYGDRRKR